MTIECDVLIVGGGPAGSSAARAAAKKGAKTILIEEHSKIGKPVQCAEGIGKYLIPYLPFNIPQEQLKWEIKGMTFWADDILIERNGGIWAGHTLNRSEWDEWLASLATKEGAEIKTSSKLIDLDFNDNYIVKKATIGSKGKKIEVKPKVVIGADGVDSTVVNLLKIKKEVSNSIGEVKSFELNNVDLKYPNHDQLFLGDFAPGAYGYIFPISKNRANIGIGKIKDNKKNIDKLYEEFLDIPIVKKQIKNGSSVVEKGGYAPLKNNIEKWNYGNIIFSGDSANQNFKPFIEGNIPAIICGDIAGKIASSSISNKKFLTKYEKKIYNRLGPMFKNSDEVLDILLNIYEATNESLLYFLIFSNIYPINKVNNLSKKDNEYIKEIINNWKDSKIKQYKTSSLEKIYLLILSFMKIFRRE